MRRANGTGWFWRGVLLPFAVTRAALLLVGWFSRYFQSWHRAPSDAAARGWLSHPARMLDMWARWDSGWYLAIARQGYVAGPINGENRIAFYPAYPTLVGSLERLLPRAWQGTGALLGIGVMLSNLSALAAAALLYRHARDLEDEASAGRAVLYLLVFPTAFFLSCFYTESLFLLFAIGSFHAARCDRWRWAGVLGGLAALTRSTGVLLLPALGWMALESAQAGEKGWARYAWLLLIPCAFGGYAVYGWSLTGDPLAVLHVQTYWLRSLSPPWATLFHPRLNNVYVTPVDGALTLLAVILGLVMLWRLPSRSYGIYTLLCVASFAFTGTLNSAARYVLCAFPIFFLLARAGRNQAFDRAYVIVGVALQTLLLAGWTRLYWVG
jgi:Mannosyltransferase (PIG-V)